LINAKGLEFVIRWIFDSHVNFGLVFLVLVADNFVNFRDFVGK